MEEMTKTTLEKKEMEIAEKINNLKPIGEAGPVVDGIIDIDRYADPNLKCKILWILKEVNFGNKGSGNIRDYYKSATEANIKKHLTTNRVMQVSYRILSDINPKISPLDAFKSIAYINIKKIAGGNQSDDDVIKEAYETNKHILKEQIDTYNPDIIICGHTLHYFEDMLNFRLLEQADLHDGGNHHYFYDKKRLYISTWHPAYPKIADKDYCESIFNAFSYWKGLF
jgi:hypothetical protein